MFYRDLIGPTGYGGTRYFPLFFTIIGALLKIGLPPLVAGWTASAIAALILSTGLARVGRALGAPRSMQWLLAACAIAPYFVQQTLFEVRADVIAAGLNLWGLASIVPVFRDEANLRPRTGAAALWFTLAFAAKITSLAVPACVLAALVLSRRVPIAVRFAAQMAAGLALFLGIVELASAGRALVAWRATMFAGSSQSGTVTAMLSGDFIGFASFSHLLTVLLVLDVAVLVAAFVAGARALWLPVVLFGGVSVTAALTLSSPGTIPSNQIIEWLQMSFVVFLFAAVSRPELTRALSALLAAMVVWMAVQDVVRVRHLYDTRAERTTAAVRNDVARFVGAAPAPVLAESSLWEVLAGQQAYLLDPFALRVVMMKRPDIARDLEQKIDAHYFSSVIFQVDPTTAQGRGYYEHVNFGWPITARILEQYRFDRQPAHDVFIYVPK
ncbi:MAG TPA: hypothetical protein VJN96_14595 [Vicinamibacterales bacterium]|nr:hypothetical protein [Vicinamibacterales bacterium]